MKKNAPVGGGILSLSSRPLVRSRGAHHPYCLEQQQTGRDANTHSARNITLLLYSQALDTCSYLVAN